MQLWYNPFFPLPHPHPQWNSKTPNRYLWLDLPIILNIILLDREFHHRSFLDRWARHECTFKGCCPTYNGCSVIRRCLIMGVLILCLFKNPTQDCFQTISPNIIALHQQHKSYMYPNAIHCCNLKSIKVNQSMANKNKET